MKCYECGMKYTVWELCEEPCEESGDCHDWEQGLDEE